MTTARAAVLVAPHQPLEFHEYPVPDALAPGELLIRVEMAGICGTDVHLWKGELPIPLPVILGHETVGRIAALGEGVERDWRGGPLAVGDRVTWASSIVCGECYYCQTKRQPTRCVSRKAYGISYPATQAPHLRGGYAEMIALRAGTAVFKLPDTLAPEALLGGGCALTTALHGLERAPVQPGDTVVIQGSGPVGLAALAVAREAGASRTVMIGGPPHRLRIARDFGADAVIDIDEVSSLEARRELVFAAVGPFGADCVIECVGHPAAVNEGILLARDGGQYLVLGQYADAGNIAFNPHTITRKQLRVIGSWGFEPRHVSAAIDLLERTDWKHRFAGGITHRFPLAQANEALMCVRDCLGGKTVLVNS